MATEQHGACKELLCSLGRVRRRSWLLGSKRDLRGRMLRLVCGGRLFCAHRRVNRARRCFRKCPRDKRRATNCRRRAVAVPSGVSLCSRVSPRCDNLGLHARCPFKSPVHPCGVCVCVSRKKISIEKCSFVTLVEQKPLWSFRTAVVANTFLCGDFHGPSAQSIGTFPGLYLARGRTLVIDVVFTS